VVRGRVIVVLSPLCYDDVVCNYCEGAGREGGGGLGFVLI
jgi:hypothetical protein